MPRYLIHRVLGDVTDDELEAAAESLHAASAPSSSRTIDVGALARRPHRRRPRLLLRLRAPERAARARPRRGRRAARRRGARDRARPDGVSRGGLDEPVQWRDSEVRRRHAVRAAATSPEREKQAGKGAGGRGRHPCRAAAVRGVPGLLTSGVREGHRRDTGYGEPTRGPRRPAPPWRWSYMREIRSLGSTSVMSDCSSWRAGGGDDERWPSEQTCRTPREAGGRLFVLRGP